MKFTLYWLTGDKDIVEGEDIAQAITLAGFSQGAVPALDFHAKGENSEYEFVNGRWEKKKEET